MGTVNRREILGRLAAALATPFLLGRQAVDMALRVGKGTPPPEAPPRGKALARPTLAPPSHSVKRRG